MLCSVKKIVIAEFQSSTELVRAVLCLYESSPKVHADLYEYYGKYRLVIHSANSAEPDFAKIKNTYVEYFKTTEYGNIIVKDAAISLDF